MCTEVSHPLQPNTYFPPLIHTPSHTLLHTLIQTPSHVHPSPLHTQVNMNNEITKLNINHTNIPFLRTPTTTHTL